MSIPAFNESELKVVSEIPSFFGGPATPIFDFPVKPREAILGYLQRKPIWQTTSVEGRLFAPKIIPDNIARATTFEINPIDMKNAKGGKDMFGVDWEYVPTVGGSMVRPGNPMLKDANDWKEIIVWPDIDSWDWEQCAKENNGTYLNDDKFTNVWFMTGWFERLISFMEFEEAIFAIFDEDQKDAVKELFDKLSDLYIKIFDKFITYFPNVDGFLIHDDWGAQKETFFSPAVVEEMIVPYMRRVTDFLHSKGKYCELHSCGQIFKQVPNIIKAGWDSWQPQTMNDIEKIYDLYGDQLIIGTMPEAFDPMTTPEEEQRKIAREYADKYCKPDKPSFMNVCALGFATPAFREELYRQSRIRYGRK